jgi:hypothetical protein
MTSLCGMAQACNAEADNLRDPFSRACGTGDPAEAFLSKGRLKAVNTILSMTYLPIRWLCHPGPNLAPTEGRDGGCASGTIQPSVRLASANLKRERLQKKPRTMPEALVAKETREISKGLRPEDSRSRRSRRTGS